MAKDPAFLFYSADFMIGTMFFTDEQVGKYTRLLCLQHQHGELTKEEVLSILKVWDNLIMKKFKQTKNGRYFNERLKEESTKRQAFCESRRLSRTSNVRQSYVQRMENENENENEDINVIKKDRIAKERIFRRPTLEQVVQYCKEIGSKIDPEQFFHHYQSSDWIKANGQKVKNWKSTIITWDKRDHKPVDMLTETQRRNVAKFKDFEKRMEGKSAV